jgi:hypothetical protein
VPEELEVSVCELDPEGQGVGEMEPGRVAVGQPMALGEGVPASVGEALGHVVVEAVEPGEPDTLSVGEVVGVMDADDVKERVGDSEALALLLKTLDCVTEGEEVGDAVEHSVGVPVPASERLVLALGEGEGVAMEVSEGDWLVESDVLPVMQLHAEGEAEAAHDALARPEVLRDGEDVAEREAVTEAVPLRAAVGLGVALDVEGLEIDAVPLNEAPTVAVMEGKAVMEVLDEEEVLPETLPASLAEVSGLRLVQCEAVGEALAVPSGLSVIVSWALGEEDEEAQAVTEADAQPEALE